VILLLLLRLTVVTAVLGLVMRRAVVRPGVVACRRVSRVVVVVVRRCVGVQVGG
jgi:hypothetical protein